MNKYYYLYKYAGLQFKPIETEIDDFKVIYNLLSLIKHTKITTIDFLRSYNLQIISSIKHFPTGITKEIDNLDEIKLISDELFAYKNLDLDIDDKLRFNNIYPIVKSNDYNILLSKNDIIGSACLISLDEVLDKDIISEKENDLYELKHTRILKSDLIQDKITTKNLLLTINKVKDYEIKTTSYNNVKTKKITPKSDNLINILLTNDEVDFLIENFELFLNKKLGSSLDGLYEMMLLESDKKNISLSINKLEKTINDTYLVDYIKFYFNLLLNPLIIDDIKYYDKFNEKKEQILTTQLNDKIIKNIFESQENEEKLYSYYNGLLEMRSFLYETIDSIKQNEFQHLYDIMFSKLDLENYNESYIVEKSSIFNHIKEKLKVFHLTDEEKYKAYPVFVSLISDLITTSYLQNMIFTKLANKENFIGFDYEKYVLIKLNNFTNFDKNGE